VNLICSLKKLISPPRKIESKIRIRGKQMRVVTEKLEYLIECSCGIKIAYSFNECLNQNIACPSCNRVHKLNGDHEIIATEKCKVYYNNHLLDYD